MKYFEYKQPENLEQAGQWLNQADKNNLPISGGTDLLGLIKHHIIQPDNLINLKSIRGQDRISYKKGSGLTIGAQVKIAEIAENKDIQTNFPLVSEAAAQVASPQLRNMGTIGGNLCQRPRCWYFRGNFDCLRKGGDTCYAIGGENKFHCITGGNPCFIVHPSDMAVALLAANATLSIFSGNKTKTIPIIEFFLLPEQDILKENILKPGEIITDIFIPELPAGAKSHFIKIKERASWDFAVVSIAGIFKLQGNKIQKGMLSFGGIAPKPWTDEQINKQLNGLTLNSSGINRFVAGLFSDAEPMEKNEYKIQLIRNLVKMELENLTN